MTVYSRHVLAGGQLVLYNVEDMVDRPLPPRLTGITPVLLVGDIAATMKWYAERLGFYGRAVPESPPHHFAIITRDDATIFLQQLTGHEKPDLYERREGGVWAAYIQTDDVRGLYDALKEHPDVVVLEPLRHQEYGQTEFVIRDPNGYALAIAEPD